MKKRILSIVLALTMVIGSFNVVFAKEKPIIDSDSAYVVAYAECNSYTGYASTSCYVTDQIESTSASVSAVLYYYDYRIGDSDSDSGSISYGGDINVSVQLAYYGVEARELYSEHEVMLDGVTHSTELVVEN